MSLQNIFSSIKIFFNYLFENLIMGINPTDTTTDDDDYDYETIYLNNSMTSER